MGGIWHMEKEREEVQMAGLAREKAHEAGGCGCVRGPALSEAHSVELGWL